MRSTIEGMSDVRFSGVRWALLTTHLACYGMGRMGEAFAESYGVDYRVFTDEAECLRWLLKR